MARLADRPPVIRTPIPHPIGSRIHTGYHDPGQSPLRMHLRLDRQSPFGYTSVVMRHARPGEVTELAEGARLEIVCALTGYRGFESLPLRHIANNQPRQGLTKPRFFIAAPHKKKRRPRAALRLSVISFSVHQSSMIPSLSISMLWIMTGPTDPVAGLYIKR